MDEKYRRIRGQWRYLYTAVDKNGNTVDVLRAHRGKTAARRYFEKTTAQNGVPETATNDKNGASLAALKEINADREAAIKIPTSLRSTSSGDLICGK
jgi:transposase-like protein